MNIDQQQSLLMSPIDRKISTLSDGSESGVGSESNPYSDGDQENRLVILFLLVELLNYSFIFFRKLFRNLMNVKFYN